MCLHAITWDNRGTDVGHEARRARDAIGDSDAMERDGERGLEEEEDQGYFGPKFFRNTAKG